MVIPHQNLEDSEDTDIALSRYDREGSLASLSDLPESIHPPNSPSRSISSVTQKEDPDMAKFLKFAGLWVHSLHRWNV